MREFLDVGAHDGQTLQEVISHPFDRVFAFEPMAEQYENLRRRFGDGRQRFGAPTVELLPYGLSDRGGEMLVYGSNDEMEASVFPGKIDVDPRTATLCSFVEASAFFALRLSAGDDVTVKLNCEGSEIAILDNLADTGELWKIRRLMVDFDVRKIPGMEAEDQRICARLESLGFAGLARSEEVMVGDTHQERIRNWLNGVDRDEYLARAHR